ncbi:hypothetical protein ACLOJK_012722 [Asimina triloba]
MAKTRLSNQAETILMAGSDDRELATILMAGAYIGGEKPDLVSRDDLDGKEQQQATVGKLDLVGRDDLDGRE